MGKNDKSKREIALDNLSKWSETITPEQFIKEHENLTLPKCDVSMRLKNGISDLNEITNDTIFFVEFTDEERIEIDKINGKLIAIGLYENKVELVIYKNECYIRLTEHKDVTYSKLGDLL